MPPALPFARAARRPRLSRDISFWLLGAIQLLLLFAAGAPSPLYPLYQAEWGFGPTAVTLVFALYAFGLLAALLVVGSLSDHIGRRPVLIVSLLVEIAAMVVFIEAAGLGWLLVARGIQGLATGAAMGAIGAGLVDLQPLHKPRLGPLVGGTSILLGLALGGLGTGLLVRYAPAPTMLVYLVLIAAFAITLAGVVFMPETTEGRPGALRSLLPRASLPPRLRPHVLVITPSLVALWAVGGFHLSLGPALTATVLGERSAVLAGAVIAVLTGAGALGQLFLQRTSPLRILSYGSVTLVAGMLITLIGVAATAPAAYLMGTALAGFGYGASFLGAMRSLAARAEPTERAAVFSIMFLISYLAFGLPAVAAGVSVTRVGLALTSSGYAVAVIALALLALIGLYVQQRRTAPRPAEAARPQPARQST
ncbi:MFS transporter [Streptomyces viridiviolaceus]|uniref:MFS transporter n=1 Tax=Streptomyces viridiviolaceus TaxID=68282 RepID=A0ABW2E033_9ACTN|nr:MFS transporter [Streptomyces viridiviolaceus]GHB72274.1 MFS transporter [Streptomyces viridiviolaceus]